MGLVSRQHSTTREVLALRLENLELVKRKKFVKRKKGYLLNYGEDQAAVFQNFQIDS